MTQATGVGNQLVICAQLHRISTDCPGHKLQKMTGQTQTTRRIRWCTLIREDQNDIQYIHNSAQYHSMQNTPQIISRMKLSKTWAKL